jgi:hypothetical protein
MNSFHPSNSSDRRSAYTDMTNPHYTQQSPYPCSNLSPTYYRSQLSLSLTLLHPSTPQASASRPSRFRHLPLDPLPDRILRRTRIQHPLRCLSSLLASYNLGTSLHFTRVLRLSQYPTPFLTVEFAHEHCKTNSGIAAPEMMLRLASTEARMASCIVYSSVEPSLKTCIWMARIAREVIRAKPRTVKFEMARNFRSLALQPVSGGEWCFLRICMHYSLIVGIGSTMV